MRADALATACMVLGEQAALEMINKTTDAACYLIIADSDTLRIATSQRWYFE
jgi:thiamine biosynthesis lipoprotein ApbE